MRDSMNNALKKAKIDLIIIMIVKMQKKNNIVLRILKKYIANILLAQRAIWKHVFDVKSIKKDEKWHKIVIHSLKIEIFKMKTEMKNLKTELEFFNLELKLIINFIWLFKSENRSRNRHASTILAFKTEAEAQRYLKKRLVTAKSIKKTKNIVMYINASQIRKKIAEIKTETETTVIFTHELVKFSKVTSVSDKIITTKAKLQAISDAIAICSEKALKNSEIWVYMNSQMTLQRLNAKSNVNAKLFNDIRQNLTNLRQNQCQIRIQ